jgi:glycosyltransferase involved in cell wall biosynthesis
LISVALCTHNGARFLADQIRSICLQTLPPQEIILSDDASSDGSVEVARRTLRACKDTEAGLSIRLKVLENATPLGVTKNFERAVSACSGQLIALSDQDDVWHPGRLARMADEFERRPDLLLLHTDARLVGAELQDLGESLFHALEVRPFELDWIHEGRAFDVFLRRNLVTGATTMFRRSLLLHAVPFPAEWLHDEWLAVIASASGRVDVLEDALIDYRQHGGNQIGAGRRSLIANIRRAFSSRGSYYALRAAKAELLLVRLLLLGSKVPSDTIAKTRGKGAHERYRATLPVARISRLWPVLRTAMSGRYDTYGMGFQSIVRDLFERA